MRITHYLSIVILTLLLIATGGPQVEADNPSAPASPKPGPSQAGGADGWRDLVQPDSLKGWKITKFGGEGDVAVKDREITLESGNPLTGITLDGDPPLRQDYEIRLETQRASGTDFFCGLTLPVGDSYCSLILGGWGGALVGISCIDGFDASENATTSYENFENGKWYQVRVRVTRDRLQAWLDDKSIVDQELEGHKLSTRIEVDLSQPLGIASYNTRAVIRGLQIRPLPATK